MARTIRSFIPGLPVHLVHRGNNRQAVFRGESDFQIFKKCLSDALAATDMPLHCYVLMDNHVHLLVTPPAAQSISDAMRIAIRRYSGYFNERYQRTGTLWEGRFHASSIDSDRYLLACHRYIELNPVRAGRVARAEDYRWSSHRRLAFGTKDELVSPHFGIAALASSPAYLGLFREPVADAAWDQIRSASRSGRTLSDVPAATKRGRPRKPQKTAPGPDLRAGDGAQLRGGEVALQEREPRE